MAVVDVEAVFTHQVFTVPHARSSFATTIVRHEVARKSISRAPPTGPLVDDELKAFGEQRPDSSRSQSSPISAAMPSSASPFFRNSRDFACVAAQKTEIQPVELPPDLIEMRDHQRQVDRMGGMRSEAPTSPLLNDDASGRAPVAASSHCWSSGRMRRPSSVSWAAGRSRRNRSPPSSASSCLMARVSDGWVTLQASAARVKLSVRATARK